MKGLMMWVHKECWMKGILVLDNEVVSQDG